MLHFLTYYNFKKRVNVHFDHFGFPYFYRDTSLADGCVYMWVSVINVRYTADMFWDYGTQKAFDETDREGGKNDEK